ncbi:MAG: bifunctional adenosylcobinamide kinase/adenosylcobinamide-phosphate guanylyltransferase [Lachnospiraceae bacterium]|nr:bifunctional adenosylcobinamide kinase/adenosylcobinamide-phosphate guanylyltransferase [Lachnospiraceae bacterium]
MKLYFGGAWQGKETLVRKTHGPEAKILPAYHLRVREQLREGQDPVKELERLVKEEPELILICDEVGCGIVPAEAEEERYREAVGRTLCRAAELSDEVFRVQCGIGIRIK